MNLYFNNKRNLHENYGIASNNYHFSLLNSDATKPLHPFFMCKDYYHDLMFTQIHDVKFTIYGYYASKTIAKQFLLEDRKFSIAVRHGILKDNTFYPKENGLIPEYLVRLLNDVENILGLELSYVTYFGDEQFAIIESHTDWLQIPWLQSLYFSLIRVHNFYKEDLEIKEYLTTSMKTLGGGPSVGQINMLFRNPDFTESFFNNQFELSNSYGSNLKGSNMTIHNHLGMLGFINSYKDMMLLKDMPLYLKHILKFENKKTMKEVIAYTKELYSAASPASNLVTQE